MKNEFIKFVYEEELITKKDNLYIAKDAFKINAIIKWCMEEGDPNKLASYINLIKEYLSGSINIYLENDRIMIQEKSRGANGI